MARPPPLVVICKRYKLKFKLEVLSVMEHGLPGNGGDDRQMLSLNQVATHFKICSSMLSRWRKQRPLYIKKLAKTQSKQIVNKNVTSTHPGPAPLIANVTDRLLEFVQDKREQSLPVNYNDVVVYASQIDRDFRNRKSDAARYGAVRRLMKMNGIVSRRVTHVAQKDQEDPPDYSLDEQDHLHEEDPQDYSLDEQDHLYEEDPLAYFPDEQI